MGKSNTKEKRDRAGRNAQKENIQNIRREKYQKNQHFCRKSKSLRRYRQKDRRQGWTTSARQAKQKNSNEKNNNPKANYSDNEDRKENIVSNKYENHFGSRNKEQSNLRNKKMASESSSDESAKSESPPPEESGEGSESESKSPSPPPQKILESLKIEKKGLERKVKAQNH